MSTAKNNTFPVESRELSAAARALAGHRLADAAEHFLKAGRARDRAGHDALPHYLRALSLWSAGGKHARGVIIAKKLLVRMRHRPGSERGLLQLRLGELLMESNQLDQAERHLQKSFQLLATRSRESLEAGIGVCEAELLLGRNRVLSDLSMTLERDCRRYGDRSLLARVYLIRARSSHWSGEWTQALSGYSRGLELVENRGPFILTLSYFEGLADVYLRLGLLSDARAYAQRALETSRRLHDPELIARASLLHASALVTQVAVLEQNQKPGAAIGMRDEARRSLHVARRHYLRVGNRVRVADCWMADAFLTLNSNQRMARRGAANAEKLYRATGLPETALLARTLTMLSSAGTSAKSWKALARRAEAVEANQVASTAWRQVAGDKRIAFDATACIRAFETGLRKRPGLAELHASVPLAAGSVAIARMLAEHSLDDGPEPKHAALYWTVMKTVNDMPAPLGTGQLVASHDRAGIDPSAFTLVASRFSFLTAARHDLARRSGQLRPRPAERKEWEQARQRYFRFFSKPATRLQALDHELFRALPKLDKEEALVVFGELRGDVHVWVARARNQVVFHGTCATAREWRESADALERHNWDARGWPDAVIPETLTGLARKTLEELGSKIWSHLWSALLGVSRVLIVPESSLPHLPYSALALAAEPCVWPRPRSITVLPSPAQRRIRRWVKPQGKVFALASRDPMLPLAEREARSVARVLGGESQPTARYESSVDGPKKLAAQLRRAKLWHAAVPLVPHPDHPAFSHFDLGERAHPVWLLQRQNLLLRLGVFPNLSLVHYDSPAFGRVVGTVGPEGARRLRDLAITEPTLPNLVRLARALMAAGSERLILNAFPTESLHPSAVLGSFYAGLARGDTPGESLFLAQRNAWEEGLHPLLWGGYSCWGW